MSLGQPYLKSVPCDWQGFCKGTFTYKSGDVVVNPIFLTSAASRTVVGFTNPRWREEVRRGYDATTSFEGRDLAWRLDRPGYCLIRRINQNVTPGTFIETEVEGVTNINFFSVPSSVDTLSFVTADNHAKAAFLKDIIDKQGSFQGLVFAGELGKTLSMLRRPAQALRKGISDYVSTARSRARRAGKAPGAVARALSGSWLEHRFGWLQLARDIEDISESLSRLDEEHVDRVPVRGFGVEESVVSSTGSGTAPGAVNSTITTFFSKHTIRKSIVVYRGHVSVDRRGIPGIGRAFGLSTENFFPTAWELIPYSFLVDYFTNIGDIILAASYGRAGLRWSNRTVIRSETIVTEGYHMQPQAAYVNTFRTIRKRMPKSTSWRKLVERNSYSGSLTPDLEFSLPGSNLRWLNIAALAAQRFL